jgi:phosphohistidine phosphatase
MELYFLRHGIAADKKAYRHDSERPLTPEGIANMKKAAQGMKVLGISPHRVFSSPFVRAHQTAELAAEGVGFPKEKIEIWDSLIPDAGFGDFLEDLKRLAPDESYIFVGHEPSISGFASRLLMGNEMVCMRFDKGGLCHLHLEEEGGEAWACLVSFFDSRQLQLFSKA